MDLWPQGAWLVPKHPRRSLEVSDVVQFSDFTLRQLTIPEVYLDMTGGPGAMSVSLELKLYYRKGEP